jgi:hypothetical protein
VHDDGLTVYDGTGDDRHLKRPYVTVMKNLAKASLNHVQKAIGFNCVEELILTKIVAYLVRAGVRAGTQGAAGVADDEDKRS